MLKLADTMYKANGFDKGPNIIVTDTKDTQRGLDKGTIYINLEQLSSFSAGDLVNVIAHESSHSEVLGESEETFAIEKGSRAKDKFDSPKDTEKVDLDGYLDTLEGEYTKEKIRLAEVKEKLPEEEGEEFTSKLKDALATKDPRIILGAVAVATIVEVHSYAYNNNPTYKNLVDEGIIKIEEGRLYLRGKLVEGLKLTKEMILGFMSDEKGPKFEEGFGKDSNALTDFLREKEGFSLVNNQGYTESMDYDKPLDFKESFPSGEKQGVVILTAEKNGQNKLPKNVEDSYEKYEKNGWKGHAEQSSGTKAGEEFKNKKGDLPKKDSYGKDIKYKEYDVNNKIFGKNRDAERFVKGSDGSIYYTDNHYESFKKIK